MENDLLSGILPLPMRFLVAAVVLSAMAFFDWRKHGKAATRYKEYGFLVGATLVAIAFAEVHDAITVRISPEYFIVGKGLGAENLHWNVAALAVRASYWVGLLLGLFFLIANNPIKGIPRLGYLRLAKFMALPIAGAVVAAIGMGTLYASTLPDPDRAHSFVWGFHTGSYAGALLGALIAVSMIVRERYLNREPGWTMPHAQLGKLDRLIAAGLVFVVATEVFSSFLSDDWFLDIVVHYRWIRLFVAACMISWLLFRLAKLYGWAWIGVISLLFIAVRIYDSTIAQDIGAAPIEQKLNVISFNVLTDNKRTKDVVDWIRNQAKPGTKNLVFLMEVNDEWIKALAPLKQQFPHSFEKPREDNFGLAVYSDMPIQDAKAAYFDDNRVPAAEGTVSFFGEPIHFFGVHPVPPGNEQGFHDRNEYLLNLRKAVDRTPGDVLVLGDLNCSPHSKHFKNFLSAGERGLGNTDQAILQSSTWFGAGWLFSVPIDYILVSSSKLRRLSFEVGPDLGSDHRPVKAEFDRGLYK